MTIIGLESPVEPRQRAALVQAAVVTALEFRGREAARTDLPQRTLAAQEENECIRIARDLHDDTGQLIAALKVSLDTAGLALSVAPKEAARHIDDATTIADSLLDGVHRATADLRPPVLPGTHSAWPRVNERSDRSLNDGRREPDLRILPRPADRVRCEVHRV